jgi:hypothetical protein
VLAALNPIFTIFLESILGCQFKHPLVYVTVALLTVGAALVAYGQMSTQSRYMDSSIEIEGVLFMLAAVMSSSLKYVLLRRLSVRTKHKIGTVSFVFWVDMMAFSFLAILALVTKEFDTLVSSIVDSAKPLQLSIVIFISASFGGLRFFTEVYALRFVAAIDLSAAKSFANVIFLMIALMLPTQVINSDAPQFEDAFVMNPAYVIVGVTLVTGSLIAYWFLQRWLGPEGLVVHSCAPGICRPIVDLLGDADSMPENASGIAARDTPHPFKCECCGVRGSKHSKGELAASS